MLSERLRQFMRGTTRDLLDVGCGPGTFLRLMPAWTPQQYTGLDISPGMIAEAAKRYPDATLVEGSVEAMPFAPHRFDRVVSLFSALSYVTAPMRALQEIRRVLRPGGRALLMVYAPRWYRHNVPTMGAVNVDLAPAAWTSWQAEQRCEQAGLADVSLSAFSILPDALMRFDPWFTRWHGAGRYLIIEATRP